ncbi:dynamin-2 [Striga asiatica]|uniref:Dynamin-2 n=1 Tax=Striga asiatica TaxID=4170 RepID=A0A5A7PKY1_STRAF|nr:dynamin-2 [Striga asiatica]
MRQSDDVDLTVGESTLISTGSLDGISGDGEAGSLLISSSSPSDLWVGLTIAVEHDRGRTDCRGGARQWWEWLDGGRRAAGRVLTGRHIGWDTAGATHNHHLSVPPPLIDTSHQPPPLRTAVKYRRPPQRPPAMAVVSYPTAESITDLAASATATSLCLISEFCHRAIAGSGPLRRVRGAPGCRGEAMMMMWRRRAAKRWSTARLTGSRAASSIGRWTWLNEAVSGIDAVNSVVELVGESQDHLNGTRLNRGKMSENRDDSGGN